MTILTSVAIGLLTLFSIVLTVLSLTLLLTHRRIGDLSRLSAKINSLDTSHAEQVDAFNRFVKRSAVRSSREKAAAAQPVEGDVDDVIRRIEAAHLG